MADPGDEIKQEPGEPDNVFALRVAAHNVYLQEQLVPGAVSRIAGWRPVSGALRAWAEEAPLPEGRLDDINKAHGSIPGHKEG